MATFAERFKKLQRKYYGVDSKGVLNTSSNSASITAAFESEAEALYKEQEAMKQALEAKENKKPNAVEGGTLPTVPEGINAFAKGGSTNDDKFYDYISSQEGIGDIGSAAAPIISNLIAMNNVKGAKRVAPHVDRARMSINPTWYDSSTIETNYRQNMATGINNLRENTGDFDSFLRGISTINYSTNQAIGQANLEGQKLNILEQARIDKILNDNETKYTDTLNVLETQADKDYYAAQVREAKDKREYINAMGSSLGNVFSDISDAALAKRLGLLYKELAILKGSKK